MSTDLNKQSTVYQSSTGAGMALAAPGIQTQQRVATGGDPSRMDLSKKRRLGDTVMGILLFLCGALSILTTISLVLVLLVESSKFFRDPAVTFQAFVTGTVWQPQILQFGVWPLLNATLMVSGIAMLVALPLGLMAAILLSEYAAPRVRATLKPILEILAGVPTVVYGYFALTFMTPFLRVIFGTLSSISMVLVAVVWGGLLLLTLGLLVLGRRMGSTGFGRFLTILGIVVCDDVGALHRGSRHGRRFRHIDPDLQHGCCRPGRRHPGHSAGRFHV